MITIEQYLSAKNTVDTFEKQVKAAVLTLNGKKPENFELGCLDLSYYKGEFHVHTHSLIYGSADHEVMAFLEAKTHSYDHCD